MTEGWNVIRRLLRERYGMRGKKKELKKEKNG